MKISFIIPYYNSEKYISRCLDSILIQGLEFSDFEIIIINDGSTNNNYEAINLYAHNYFNIHIYHKENNGVGSARNKGVELAKGEYIYILDADDYLASNVFKLILEFIEKNELDILTFLSTGTSDSSLNNSFTKLDSNYVIDKMIGTDFIIKYGFENVVWTYLFKKDILLVNGIRFNETFWFEDAIFTVELYLKAKAIAHIPIDVHRHVLHPNSAMTSKVSSHYIRIIYDMEKVILKFDSIIKTINDDSKINKKCIDQIRARQHSFVLFLLIRTLKSKLKLSDVKAIIKTLKSINAYPIKIFSNKDYFSIKNVIISKIFNIKFAYYLLFFVFKKIYK